MNYSFHPSYLFFCIIVGLGTDICIWPFSTDNNYIRFSKKLQLAAL